MSNPDGVLEAIDACVADWSVSQDAVRWTPEPKLPEARLEEALAGFAALTEGVGRAFEAASRELAPVLKGIERTFHKLGHQGDRKHYRRCPTCNPYGFPKGMSVDRSGYRHLQRRRRQR